jgi:hypothetical protein
MLIPASGLIDGIAAEGTRPAVQYRAALENSSNIEESFREREVGRP